MVRGAVPLKMCWYCCVLGYCTCGTGSDNPFSQGIKYFDTFVYFSSWIMTCLLYMDQITIGDWLMPTCVCVWLGFQLDWLALCCPLMFKQNTGGQHNARISMLANLRLLVSLLVCPQWWVSSKFRRKEKKVFTSYHILCLSWK